MFMSRWANGLEHFSGEELTYQWPLQNDRIYGIFNKFQQRQVSNKYGFQPGRCQDQEFQQALNCKYSVQYLLN